MDLFEHRFKPPLITFYRRTAPVNEDDALMIQAMQMLNEKGLLSDETRALYIATLDGTMTTLQKLAAWRGMRKAFLDGS